MSEPCDLAPVLADFEVSHGLENLVFGELAVELREMGVALVLIVDPGDDHGVEVGE